MILGTRNSWTLGLFVNGRVKPKAYSLKGLSLRAARNRVIAGREVTATNILYVSRIDYMTCRERRTARL